MRIFIAVTLAATLAAFVTPAYAQTYTVTTNDGAMSTEGSFLWALNQIKLNRDADPESGGETIVFDGDYTIVLDAQAQPYWEGAIDTWVLGGNDYTIDGGDNTIVFDGQGAASNSGLYINSGPNITLKNVEVTGKRIGIHVTGDTSTNILIEGCSAYDPQTDSPVGAAYAGIYIEGADPNVDKQVVVRNCTMYNIAVDAPSFGLSVGDGAASGVRVEGCTAYDNGWANFWASANGSGYEFVNNTAYNAGAGLTILTGTDYLIQGNYFYNNGNNLTIAGGGNDAFSGADNVTVIGNVFGFDRNGVAVPNRGGNGIFINERASNVTIGGTGPGEMNVVANSWDGIWYGTGWEGSTGGDSDVTVLANAIYNHDAEGDDAGTGRAIGWDSGSVAVPPIPASVALGSVTGTATANAQVDVYVDPGDVGDTTQPQMRTYVGTTMADGSGEWTLDVDVAALYPGLKATAVAIDPTTGDTSPPAPGVDIPGTPKADSDNDGMPDEFEAMYGLNPDNPLDAWGDTNEDGTTNVMHYIEGTAPGTAGVPAASVWGLMAAAVAVAAAGTGLVVRRNSKK